MGSLNSARGDALNGDSGFGDCVDVDVVVDKVARKSVVDDGVCSNGRARALRRTERASMVKCCTCRPCVCLIAIGVFERPRILRLGCRMRCEKLKPRRASGEIPERASGRVGVRNHVIFNS